MLPLINLSDLTVRVMKAIEEMREHERIHGPISQRGPKKGEKRLTKKRQKD